MTPSDQTLLDPLPFVADERIRPEVAALVRLEPTPKFVVSGTPLRDGKFETTIGLSWRLIFDASAVER